MSVADDDDFRFDISSVTSDKVATINATTCAVFPSPISSDNIPPRTGFVVVNDVDVGALVVLGRLFRVSRSCPNAGEYQYLSPSGNDRCSQINELIPLDNCSCSYMNVTPCF